MSLRLRLTAFYTLLMGVALTLFGVAIYAQVETILIDQFNQKLENAILDPTQALRSTEQGDYALATFLSFDKSLVFHLWDLRTFHPTGIMWNMFSTIGHLYQR